MAVIRSAAEQQHQEDAQDLTRLLPDDALAEVIRAPSPRAGASATTRGACCARTSCRSGWPAYVFVNFHAHGVPEMFGRPAPFFGAPAISGRLDFLPAAGARSKVRDHCNGLLLFDDYVANPATRWCHPVPPPPPSPPDAWTDDTNGRRALRVGQIPRVRSHGVAAHYQVFMISRLRLMDTRYVDPATDGSEWPLRTGLSYTT
ncbi:hypothetical protein ACP70R_015749 [Stipagrostis hirtigluma subsp. patula]